MKSILKYPIFMMIFTCFIVSYAYADNGVSIDTGDQIPDSEKIIGLSESLGVNDKISIAKTGHIVELKSAPLVIINNDLKVHPELIGNWKAGWIDLASQIRASELLDKSMVLDYKHKQTEELLKIFNYYKESNIYHTASSFIYP